MPESPSPASPTARPSPWASALAAALPSALAGLGAAGVAATFDVLRANDLARFLGPGGGALWLALFLTCLYGALAGIVGLGIGLSQQGLTRLAMPASGEDGTESRQSPPWLVALAGLVALTVAGAVLRPAAMIALQRFHHRGLLSLLLTGYGLLTCAGPLLVAQIALRTLPFFRTGKTSSAPRAPSLPTWARLTLGVALFLPLGNEAVARIQIVPRLGLPQRALAVAVALPLVAGACILIVALLHRLLDRVVARSVGRLALLVISLLLPLVSLAGLLYRQREALRVVDLRLLQTVVLALLVGAVGLWRLPRCFRSTGRGSLALALALPCLLWLGALQLGQRESLRKAALSLAPVAERIILTQALILDLDGDGVAGRLSIGGGDCDDWDDSRHPGAFDWPDNGIDENCNGHDATTRPPSAASNAPLPDALPSQPNIVLITIDALRADHVSVYGYPRPTTPRLAELAADADAVVFDSAWAHAPSTRYSVPAILTGRYPSTIVWGSPQVHWPPEVLPQNRLISELLRDRGYSTTALLSYHYFEPAWGLARGFADYDTHLMRLHSLGGDPAATSGSSARELTDLALAKLPTLVASGRPFFLWVHYYDPHYRYEPHPLEAGESALGDDEPDQYDNEIRYTDRHLGRLLTALRDSPAWPKTTVVVTADHGEGFGEHAIPRDRRHGYHLYANQTRVPLIVRLAGLHAAFPSAPKRIATPVGHVDLVPTILHSVLRTPPQETEKQLLGQSLLPLLTTPPAATATPDERVVFQEVMYEGPTVRKALVTSRWHLIQNLIPDGTVELYDLQNDPGETQDRAAEASLRPTREALQSRLSAWLDDSAVPPDFAARVASQVTEAAPKTAQTLSARIGDCLEVVGSDLSTSRVQHGASLQATLIFHLRCRIPAGYRLFLHLRSAGGSGPFVNADHDFLDGIVPAQHLPVGRYVRDVTHIAVPMWFPAGPATLQVGLFHKNERLPVHGPDAQILARDRAVLAATLQVGG